MKKEKQNQNLKMNSNTLGTFITQPISQPDKRQEHTNVAIPNDENVEINREWIEENQK